MELNEDRRSTTMLVLCTSSTIYFDSNSAFGPLRDMNDECYDTTFEF